MVEELEKELGRVRSFYTRKLKEMERRAENQMRALKRGGSGRGGGDSNRLGAEGGRSVHGRDDDDDAARMTRRDEADGKLQPPGGKREHQSSATTTAAAATGGRVGTHGARSSPPPFAGRLGGDGIAASSSAAFGSPSAPAASSPPVRQTASSDENRRTSCRDPREAAGHRQDGEPGARKCDNSELGLGSEESIGSNIADVLKAERARHERELEREREAAAARVAALELRLVQTAQVTKIIVCEGEGRFESLEDFSSSLIRVFLLGPHGTPRCTYIFVVFFRWLFGYETTFYVNCVCTEYCRCTRACV